MNAKQIIIEYLKSIGADGLCNDDCGCGIDDCGCGIDFSECVPAKVDDCKFKGTQKCVDCPSECEGCMEGPVYRGMDLNDAAEMG